MSNERAFPMRADVDYNHGGMYLRDYFAAKAMEALLHPSMTAHLLHETFDTVSVSDAAYMVADSMMRAREKRRKA